MDNDYSWNGGLRGTSSYRLPENEGLTKWVVAALLVAVALHAGLFVLLSRIDVGLPEFIEEKGIQTEVVRVNRVDTRDARPELSKPEIKEPLEPVPVVPPADELDMLEKMPDVEIDITPDIETIEVPMSNPAAAGTLDGESLEALKAPVFDSELLEPGKTEDFFARSRESQVAVDPGARNVSQDDPDAYTDALRKGAGGEASDGLLKDFTSLDAMARMDGNSLLASKAMIGSDLLFDFNSAMLRQGARVSLMKVALLIDKHPQLVCWVEGHTDLIGDDASNLKLSRERAMAVKMWLVDTLDIDGQRIAVRGFGKSQPLIKGGNVEQQAPNRRVEIKMRRGYPGNDLGASSDSILIKPNLTDTPEDVPVRAIPVEEDDPEVFKPTEPPRAFVIPEFDESLPRAIPVEE